EPRTSAQARPGAAKAAASQHPRRGGEAARGTVGEQFFEHLTHLPEPGADVRPLHGEHGGHATRAPARHGGPLGDGDAVDGAVHVKKYAAASEVVGVR
ncbi:unnamed protein product, partial [Prorocentrum cordatum]